MRVGSPRETRRQIEFAPCIMAMTDSGKAMSPLRVGQSAAPRSLATMKRARSPTTLDDGVTLDDVAEEPIECQRRPARCRSAVVEAMARACSRRLVYWPPGISWR